MRYLVVIILGLQFSGHVFSQDFNLGNGLIISEQQIQKIAAELPKTTEDRFFYHWTNRATGMRWISQGKISSGEVQFYNNPTGDRQVYGPGIYIAEKPTSSKSFGEVPVSFTIKKGTPIYSEQVISSVIGKRLSNEQASKLSEQIPLIRKATDDWFVTNHSQNTEFVSYGKKFSTEATVYVKEADNWTHFKISPDFKELIQSGDQDAIYLKNLLNTTSYMDGISFARAMKVNPGQPWSEFEPHNFEKFQNAIDEIAGAKDQYIKNGNNHFEKTLLEVHTALTGRKDHTNITQTLRDEGIRAGGDRVGKTFLATDLQLKTMQANPYLEVHSVPHGTNHLVHYFYPDIFHYKKLEGRISNSLYEKLSQLNHDQLLDNHDHRRNLNRQLINELIEDFSSRHKAGKANWVDLISIHPFEDMNGRTVRMMQKVFANGKAHFVLGDMDILLPINHQKMYLHKSDLAYGKLQLDLIDEFLTAKSEKRMPDYLKTGALKEYVNNAFPTLMKIDIDNQQILELIRNREWVSLIDLGETAGINDLSLALKDPTKQKMALETLLKEISPNQIQYYQDAGKIAYLSLIEVESKNPALDFKTRARLYDHYRPIFDGLAPGAQIKSTAPVKVQRIFIDEMKGAFKAANTLEGDLLGYLNKIRDVEKDEIRVLNHYISLMDKNNSKLKSKLLQDRYNVQLATITNNKFAGLTEGSQKRLLLTMKGHIEKMIIIGDKTPGTDAYKQYEAYYSIADKRVTAILPSADKLRSWTKKSGFGTCSLYESLMKLSP